MAPEKLTRHQFCARFWAFLYTSLVLTIVVDAEYNLRALNLQSFPRELIGPPALSAMNNDDANTDINQIAIDKSRGGGAYNTGAASGSNGGVNGGVKTRRTRKNEVATAPTTPVLTAMPPPSPPQPSSPSPFAHPCHMDIEYKLTKRIVGQCHNLGRNARGCIAGKYLQMFNPACF